MEAAYADEMCDICGSRPPRWICDQCQEFQLLCDDCDEMWHRHHSRRIHRRNRYTPALPESLDQLCGVCGDRAQLWLCDTCEARVLSVCDGCEETGHHHSHLGQQQETHTTSTLPESLDHVCGLCGGNADLWFCDQCEEKVLCDICEEMRHNQPHLRQHQRTRIIPHCIGERVDQQPEESSLESAHSDQTDTPSKEPEQASANHVNSPTKNWLHWMMSLLVFSKSLIVKGSHWMKSIVQKILFMDWLFRMKNLRYKDSSIKDEKLENSEQGELVNSNQEEMENSEHVQASEKSDKQKRDEQEETERRQREEQEEIERRHMLEFLRNADRDGFTADEIQHAWHKHGVNGAHGYLQSNWTEYIARAYSNLEDRPDRLPQIRQLLIENSGNVKEVVRKARKFDKDLLNRMQTLSDLPVDTVATFLQADEEKAKVQLFNHKVTTIKDQSRSTGHPLGEEEHNRMLEQLVKNKDVDIERRAVAILAEKQMPDLERARMVAEYIVAEDVNPLTTLEEIVQAGKDCRTREAFLRYLENKCVICLELHPMSKMHPFGMCQHLICTMCFNDYWEMMIRERVITNLVCPVCNEPDLTDREKCQEHCQFLLLQFTDTLSREVLDLFEKKVCDWHLQNDPIFCWCSHCDNGMMNDAQRLKIQCPSCKKHTCFKCKTQWQQQHEGITCEQFDAWQKANDPEFQKSGLEKHLAENGIECPQCKFRYALAKGGCMHFTCTQCKFEFCCGCRMEFIKGGPCRGLPVCKGLHCHHLYNCLYYLRDWDIDKLQKLLKDRSVVFITEKMGAAENTSQTCSVMEQKELTAGMKDEPCGRPVPPNHAGLCIMHYKEYLVSLINQNQIDPAVEMSLQELQQTVRRAGIDVPAYDLEEQQEEMYLTRLRQIITEKIWSPISAASAPALAAPAAAALAAAAAEGEGAAGGQEEEEEDEVEEEEEDYDTHVDADEEEWRRLMMMIGFRLADRERMVQLYGDELA